MVFNLRLSRTRTTAVKILVTFLYLWVGLVTQAFSADYQSHKVEGQSLIIQSTQGTLTLTAYHENAFEAFYQPDGVKQLPSFAIAGKPEPTEVNLVEAKNTLVFSTSELNATINKSPLRITYHRNGEVLLQEEAGLFVQDTIRWFQV